MNRRNFFEVIVSGIVGLVCGKFSKKQPDIAEEVLGLIPNEGFENWTSDVPDEWMHTVVAFTDSADPKDCKLYFNGREIE